MKYFLAIVMIFSIAAAHAQFEGKIVYRNSYKSKFPVVSDDQLSSMLGTTMEYYIKGGNYKSVTNGSMLQWQLYVNKDNKLYNKFAMSESLLWNDCSTNPNEVEKIEVHRKVTQVLGYDCDEIVMTCAKGTQTYYFNSKFKVDPKIFAKHIFYGWNKYVEQSHALPLKMIVDVDQFTMESEATEIQSMKLDNKFFDLPLNAETAPSPY